MVPHKFLMHHGSQKIIFYHNFHEFFSIGDREELGIFQLLENLKKNVLKIVLVSGHEKQSHFLHNAFILVDIQIWIEFHMC